MIKKLLAISLTAFIVTACGGSDSSSDTGSTINNETDVEAGADTNPETDSDTGSVQTPVDTAGFGGQSGTFGDTDINGSEGMATVCPATVTDSYTGWAESDGSWCVWKCPADNANLTIAPGSDYGFISGDGYTCRATDAATGLSVTAPIFAAINGCPLGGCEAGSDIDFPRVLVTDSAGAEMAGEYSCQQSDFNINREDKWTPIGTPIAVTLNADGSADYAGNDTTWSFASGVLTLEGVRTFVNVAVANGSFTSYDSNTSIVRCTI